jgi:hypothetical protein
VTTGSGLTSEETSPMLSSYKIEVLDANDTMEHLSAAIDDLCAQFDLLEGRLEAFLFT